MAEKLTGNSIIIRKDALKDLKTVNLHFDPVLGNGSWVLDVPGEGAFITPVYEVERPFNDIVASWNADTPKGTWVEVLGRVYVPGEGWSKWMSWGSWSTRIARRCDNDEDPIAWANTYRDGGDSSINVKNGKSASAFQLKAVLHANEESEMPSVRLVAATWKNTNEENWEQYCGYPEDKVEEKERVLLNSPQISQIRRDPNYGGVICSATSMTMMLGHFGESILPEEMTLMNLDYGFGGNGNWSFTTAAAGAYGYESYCLYTNFAGVRQELSKGNVVGFSVKYSRDTDSDVPFLENTAITTHGHLVTIVGYYFNEELGEYVYYCNDPAGCNDISVGPREHRESQLNQAWKRKMVYIAHPGKLPGCGKHACDHVEARLVPAGAPGVYDLVAENGPVKFDRRFLYDKRKTFGGHGSIGWFSESEETEISETQARHLANHVFHFEGIYINMDGRLCFESDWPAKRAARGEKIHLYVFENSGTTYHSMF